MAVEVTRKGHVIPRKRVRTDLRTDRHGFAWKGRWQPRITQITRIIEELLEVRLFRKRNLLKVRMDPV